jgi:hypothetical protein
MARLAVEMGARDEHSAGGPTVNRDYRGSWEKLKGRSGLN